MKKSNKGRWYIKQENSIHGPFPNQLIGRYLILGRITLDTPVSQDKQNWSAVSNYPAMVPDVVKEAGSAEGDRSLMLARIREDERSSRSGGEAELEDRRDEEEDVVQLHRQLRDDLLFKTRSEPRQRLIMISILALFIFTLLVVYLTYDGGNGARLTDCNAMAQPGINWSGCNKEGELLRSRNLQQANFRNAKLQTSDLSAAQLQQADFAYANLSRAILVSSQLQGASFKGANLYQANLQDADLSGANFSHAEMIGSQLQGADLSAAVFDHAIWVNGQKCLPGSVGSCLQAVQE